MDPVRLHPTRRQITAGLGASLTALVAGSGWAQPRADYVDGWRILRARTGQVRLRGTDAAPTDISGYDGVTPGPMMRVRRGEEVKVRLVNELTDPTTIHWHGLRLPNAMDGVPYLTQPPVSPGSSFDYRFVAPDAGTFWYHAHFMSSEQVGRGLYGPLIVDETIPLPIDRDISLVLDDWRLTADGAIAAFGGMRDAAHDGRIGNLLTVNGVPTADIGVKTNERIRLRLINAANARVMALRIEGHRANVMAIDGQPAEPFPARDGVVVLGPGNRIDLFVDATLAPGTRAPFVTLIEGNMPLARISYDAGAPARATLPPVTAPLPPNPLPAKMDFAGALKLDVPLDGGAMAMMRGGMMGGMMGRGGTGSAPASIWTIANKASDGHSGTSLFSVARGRTVMLALDNRTEFPHAMHLHGHHFRLLDRLDDGWKPFWLDFNRGAAAANLSDCLRCRQPRQVDDPLPHA